MLNTTILQILEGYDTRCMDSPEDRRVLARALRVELARELRRQAKVLHLDDSYSLAIIAHIEGMEP